MFDLLLTALAVLATYRVAGMVARERGPYNLFTDLRSWVYLTYRETSWQGEGIGCPLCVSVWAAIPFSLLLWVHLPVSAWLWPLGWLGVAGGAKLLFMWEPRR